MFAAGAWAAAGNGRALPFTNAAADVGAQAITLAWTAAAFAVGRLTAVDFPHCFIVVRASAFKTCKAASFAEDCWPSLSSSCSCLKGLVEVPFILLFCFFTAACTFLGKALGTTALA
jgi:hypothetical protein